MLNARIRRVAFVVIGYRFSGERKEHRVAIVALPLQTTDIHVRFGDCVRMRFLGSSIERIDFLSKHGTL